MAALKPISEKHIIVIWGILESLPNSVVMEGVKNMIIYIL